MLLQQIPTTSRNLLKYKKTFQIRWTVKRDGAISQSGWQGLKLKYGPRKRTFYGF